MLWISTALTASHSICRDPGYFLQVIRWKILSHMWLSPHASKLTLPSLTVCQRGISGQFCLAAVTQTGSLGVGMTLLLLAQSETIPRGFYDAAKSLIALSFHFGIRSQEYREWVADLLRRL